MYANKDSRFDNIEIAFTDCTVDMRTALTSICEGISNLTKADKLFDNVNFIKIENLKSICLKIFQKGEILFCYSRKTETELLFMRGIQVTCRGRRALMHS